MREDTEVANSLLAKLRTFVSTELDDRESEMFAYLLAPGVSLSYTQLDDAEIPGFAATSAGTLGNDNVEWRTDSLAEALSKALRRGGIRVVGLPK
jgi:hypothetical protein